VIEKNAQACRQGLDYKADLATGQIRLDGSAARLSQLSTLPTRVRVRTASLDTSEP
jgi:hypothetical protein